MLSAQYSFLMAALKGLLPSPFMPVRWQYSHISPPQRYTFCPKPQRLQRIILTLLTLLLIASYSQAEAKSPIQAPPQQEDSAFIPHLSIAVVDSYPFSYRDKQGKVQGLVADLARALVQEASPDTKITFILSSLDRVNHQVLAGKADLGYGLFHPELDKQARILKIVERVNVELWSLPTTAISLREQAIDKSIVIAARQYSTLPFLKKAKLELITASDRMIPMLINKRTDGVVDLQLALTVWANLEMLKREQFSIVTIDQVDTMIWVSSHSPINQQWNLWQKAADTTNNSETFRALVKAYEENSLHVDPK